MAVQIGSGRALILVGPSFGPAVESYLVTQAVLPHFAKENAPLRQQVLEAPPDYVFVGEVFAGRGGREWLVPAMELLGARRTKVVAYAPDAGLPEVVAWLSAGASAVWHGVDGQPELPLVPACTAPLVDRFLAYAEAQRLTGTLVFFPGLPFEGMARFEFGQLAEASLGPASGVEALADALSVDEVPLRLEQRDTVQLRPATPATRHRARLLVVEDDEAVRALVQKQLEPLGEVTGAADGLEGWALASRGEFDVAVADLAMPRLDGWGFLRRLRHHPLGRETAVLVLSAQDDMRDTLEAAKAGARAYLRKSGKARELTDAVAQLLRPRQLAWEALARGDGCEVDVAQVGVHWLVRALAELDCSGVLHAEDVMGRYELSVAHGQMAAAVAQTGSFRFEGRMALDALLASSGTARFVPNPDVQAKPTAGWLFSTLEELLTTELRAERGRLESAAQAVERLVIVDELAALYASLASKQELKVLAALRARPGSLDELSRQAGLQIDEATPVVAELLRRGVVTLHAEA